VKRRLVLRREALVELTDEEAREVAGGLSGESCVGVCMTHVQECLTRQWCPQFSERICP
jgi:hypothetical protein